MTACRHNPKSPLPAGWLTGRCSIYGNTLIIGCFRTHHPLVTPHFYCIRVAKPVYLVCGLARQRPTNTPASITLRKSPAAPLLTKHHPAARTSADHGQFHGLLGEPVRQPVRHSPLGGGESFSEGGSGSVDPALGGAERRGLVLLTDPRSYKSRTLIRKEPRPHRNLIQTPLLWEFLAFSAFVPFV